MITTVTLEDGSEIIISISERAVNKIYAALGLPPINKPKCSCIVDLESNPHTGPLYNNKPEELEDIMQQLAKHAVTDPKRLEKYNRMRATIDSWTYPPIIHQSNKAQEITESGKEALSKLLNNSDVRIYTDTDSIKDDTRMTQG